MKSAKAAMKQVLHNVTVNDEILVTAMTEVEALLNARPLTHVPVDPSEPEVLTPNHFLLGRASANLAPVFVVNGDICLRKQWRTAQVLVNQFWRRWIKEYAPYLTERRKWGTERRNLEENDVVLVVDQNSPRGIWPLARVVRALPGPDGRVRTALVKTRTGEYVRPVAKLCLLEFATRRPEEAVAVST